MKHLFEYTQDADRIPFPKVLHITAEDGPTCLYACPDYLWQEHLHEWRKARQGGNKTAPEPMPDGHLLFEMPESYGCIRWGDTSEESRRQAWENRIRADLRGWDRFLFDAMPHDEAKAKLDAIVTAAVAAKLAGKDLGASHLTVCAWLGALA